MIPWELLSTALVPGLGGELQLYQRGDEFSIRVHRHELMNSRMQGSEEQLATLACQRIATRPGVRVLIGGLGMGYTLAAALASLPADAQVVVAELVPAVVAWNRGPLANLAGAPLTDARVEVQEIDVAKLLKRRDASFAAILLDVDNGPQGLTTRTNNWLYTSPGLHAARQALQPGGVLGVWSATPQREFAGRLEQAGFAVDELRVPARQNGKGPKHTLWLAEAVR